MFQTSCATAILDYQSHRYKTETSSKYCRMKSSSFQRSVLQYLLCPLPKLYYTAVFTTYMRVCLKLPHIWLEISQMALWLHCLMRMNIFSALGCNLQPEVLWFPILEFNELIRNSCPSYGTLCGHITVTFCSYTRKISNYERRMHRILFWSLVFHKRRKFL